MIEYRWKVERWTEFPADGLGEIRHTEEPILQYREVTGIDNSNMEEMPVWSEWQDVPTEYVEV